MFTVQSFLFKSNPEKYTLWWGVIVRVCVALTAVLHQEVGVIPGHTDNTIRLMQQDVGQHAPVAVHHYDLSICSTEQNLQKKQCRVTRRTEKI